MGDFFMSFYCLLICFRIKIFKLKISFINTIRVLNILDPDQARHIVWPELAPNYLQRLSADVTNRQRVTLTIRPHKKIPVFSVTQPYLNLLVKPRILFRFSGKKYIILCILIGEMPFKMHKVIFFPDFFFKYV